MFQVNGIRVSPIEESIKQSYIPDDTGENYIYVGGYGNGNHNFKGCIGGQLKL